ncbi:zinc-binding dehydrogenase [Agromyces sp. Marseille-P2726]|uniref:zinc-dependent alcohol dehydrogenase n=1 Tax=Agromyces sp. Marseille-P2726 TaxID=2709132 RepID=UPI001570D6E2|nr:zinc-binding dehydrogenase [Agromyces sp. Marseille-P2726]
MSSSAPFARAAAYRGPENMSLEEFPIPEIGDDELLLEVIMCGVDGSELAMYRGAFDYVNERVPVIFGDEIIGRVAQIGPVAAERRGLAVGDRVIVEARWPCNEGCHACDRGQYYLCERRGLKNGYGTLSAKEPPHLWGGYSTHTFVPPEALVYSVPDDLSDRTALIAGSPFANGIRWADATDVPVGGHIAVIGPGPQGLSCALAAIATGRRATLIGLEADAERLKLAAEFGATTFVTSRDNSPEAIVQAAADIVAQHGDVDGVIEVSGSPAGKALAMNLVRVLGTVVSSASPNPSTQPFDWRLLMWKEITLKGRLSHPHTVETAFERARELRDRGIDLGDWITHVFPLDEVADAIRTAAYQTEERPIKVALDPRA